MLVLAPTVGAIERFMVEDHLRIDRFLEAATREEGFGGPYPSCDALAAEDAELVVARLRDQPNVPVAKYYDGPPHRRP